MAVRFLTIVALLPFVLENAQAIVQNNAHRIQTEPEVVMFLSKFGYLSPSMINNSTKRTVTREMLVEALTDFQLFVGLKQTGQLNNETLHYMNLPRCGMPDKFVTSTNSRLRRNYSNGNYWQVNELTYRVTKYSKQINESETNAEIRSAFRLWSNVIPVTFTHKESGPVDIEIKFEEGDHGDGHPFDENDSVVAHAFHSVLNSEVHFDDSEKWTINNPYNNGIDFFQVVVHQLGHALGLSHSSVKSALMAPFYKGYNPDLTLHEEDIEAIQKLYKPRDSVEILEGINTSDDNLSGTEDTDTEFCEDIKVDTIFNTLDEKTYVFKGNKYWKITENELAPGYPKSIASKWRGLPGNIDAAFTLKNGKTYFFKGNKYWRYAETILDEGFPKSISSGFKGIPDNIDTAVVWSKLEKSYIYFFKGTKFWKYDPKETIPVSSSYPKTIKYHWSGVPNNIDAALRDNNGQIYFFKGSVYYKLNEGTLEVDTYGSPYPKDSGSHWFGCRAAEDLQNGKEITVPVRLE